MTKFGDVRPDTRRKFLKASVCLLLTGCSGSNDNQRLNLPAPIEKSTVGPGDVFTMDVVGERDLPREYQVASDGTVDLPYLHTVPVAGLEPQEIARLIRAQLIAKQVLSDPSVVIQVKEYNSRRITIMGQVAKPGTFPYTPGLTLIQALSQAGGLTGLANLDRVNLTRHVGKGSRTVVLSIGVIMEGRAADVPLQSGDRIFVHERLF
ncbi:MAG TPA: polysaccharide biosynthesis/export family protein [Polyangiaceae bacterium]|nr:polysaccharide biosynthesis/export family protein [Polyangiaceae bacterium]